MVLRNIHYGTMWRVATAVNVGLISSGFKVGLAKDQFRHSVVPNPGPGVGLAPL